jgi:hypothetical protein
MTKAKTANDRFGGLARTNVLESKFFLAAGTPITLLAIVRAISGWSDWLWWVLFVAAALWAVFAVGLLFINVMRVLKRASNRRD